MIYKNESILKSFGIDIEKGGKKTGVYADTHENRKAGKVGQSYFKEKEASKTSTKGQDEAFKLINNLRSSTFKNLNDDELFEFRKQMANYLDLKM